MILRYIKLENIRSYLNEKIEFPEGSVLLSGDIGSGKSTILLAIEFALFGIMRAELSGTSLLRHGKNNGSVELCFSIDDKKYIVKRALKKAKENVVQDTGYIIADEKKFEGTAVELKARILNIIGYPEELITRSKSLIYRYTIYTPQEEMKEIIFADKDVRLDTLRKVFGIDKYKAIRENATIFIRELKRKQTELNIRLEPEKDLESEKKEKEEASDRLSKEIFGLKEQLDEAKLKVKEEKESLSLIEKKMKEFNELKKAIELKENSISGNKMRKVSLERRVSDIKARKASFENKIKSYADITEQKPEKNLESKLSELQEKHSAIQKEKAAHNEKLNSLKAQIMNLDKEIEERAELSKKSIVLRAEIEELEDHISKKMEQEKLLEEFKQKQERANLDLERISIEVKNSEEVINSIKDASICPLCNQEVDDVHRKEVIDEKASAIERQLLGKEKLMQALEKLSSNIEKVKRNLEKISNYEKDHRKKREEIVSLQTESKELVKKQKERSHLEDRKKELESINMIPETELLKEIEIVRKNLSEARDNNLKLREKSHIREIIAQEEALLVKTEIEASEIAEMITDAEKEKKAFSASLKNFQDIEEQYKKQTLKAESAKERQQAVEITLASLMQEKKSITERFSELEKKLSEMLKLRNKLKEMSELQDWFEDFFLNLMATMEKHIMVSIHREFSSLLKEWFSMLIENMEIYLDDEFSPNVMQDGYDTAIESLSGGEKTSIALAYRLSLNKVINDLISGIKTKDLIILDEPTDGFSTEQLDKVRDVLEQLNMKQMIIVSHEPKMESYVENIIRISKSNNVSKADSM